MNLPTFTSRIPRTGRQESVVQLSAPRRQSSLIGNRRPRRACAGCEDSNGYRGATLVSIAARPPNLPQALGAQWQLTWTGCNNHCTKPPREWVHTNAPEVRIAVTDPVGSRDGEQSGPFG